MLWRRDLIQTLLENLALKGESMKRANQRNFVPARTGFLAVFVMVLSTIFYDIVYKLPGTKFDTGFKLLKANPS